MIVPFQGYNGSQLWDVAFSVQAILATNLDDEYGSMLKKANNFIRCSQVLYIDWNTLVKNVMVEANKINTVWNVDYDK